MLSKENVKFQRYIPTYSILREACCYAMEQSKKNEGETDRFFNCMIAILFSAFCLEAYLNHLGLKKVKCWDVIQEKLSPREKLDILTKEIGIKIDFGLRPFQMFTYLFKFRNTLVHARTQFLEGEIISDLEDHRIPKPLTEWEKMITVEKAQCVLDDTKEIIGKLHIQAGLEGDPISNTGWYSSREIPDDN